LVEQKTREGHVQYSILKKGLHDDGIYLYSMMRTDVVNDDLRTVAKKPKSNCLNLHNHVTAEWASISLRYHLNIYDIVFAMENDCEPRLKKMLPGHSQRKQSEPVERSGKKENKGSKTFVRELST
jgi:hypothetical protein